MATLEEMRRDVDLAHGLIMDLNAPYGQTDAQYRVVRFAPKLLALAGAVGAARLTMSTAIGILNAHGVDTAPIRDVLAKYRALEG